MSADQPAEQQRYGQPIPLPNNFLETDESSATQTDQDIQQRIISGEYAPEPAEYNEVYSAYDPFAPHHQPHQQQFQHYQQNPYGNQQYAQLDDPWVCNTNVYAQEDFDPNADQYIYSEDQPTSSTTLVDNPFEEEDPYEPMPVVKIQPMRRVGQPPTRPAPRANVEEYDPSYPQFAAEQRGIRRNSTGADSSSDVPPDKKTKRSVLPRKQPAKRDTMEDSDDLFLSKQITDKARSQAAQRIATPEGWNCLNHWLKKAHDLDDREKIINLLETCLAAEITADLLRANDTAKLVKDIARKHPNATINRLSNDVLGMWKAAVIADTKSSKQKTLTKKPTANLKPATKASNEPAVTPKPKETTAKQETLPRYTADENLLDKLTEAMDKNVLNRKDEPSTASDDSVKRPRAKAKVKLSSSRRTGLEGDDDGVVPTASAKKDKSALSMLAAKKKFEAAANKTMAPLAPKRQLQQSDMFMAAFDEADKKTPAIKKMKTNKVVKVLQPDVPEQSTAASTLKTKSDWNVKFDSSKPQSTSNDVVERLDQVPQIHREKGAGILRRSALTPEEKSVRKIRFIDQFDQPLVSVQYFDIEEGERINVNHNYNHERIKRWEMEEEGKQLRMHYQLGGDSVDLDSITEEASMFINSSTSSPTSISGGLVKPESTSSAIINLGGKKDNQMPPLPLSGSISPSTTNNNMNDWNLMLLEVIAQTARGANSKLAELVAERERGTMAAFVDPNTPMDAVGEDDPELEAAAEEAACSQIPRIPWILQTNNAQKLDDEQIKDSLKIDDDSQEKFSQPITKLPLPFMSSSTAIVSDATSLNAVVYQNANSEPVHTDVTDNIIKSPSQTIAKIEEPPVLNKVDAFMELLKQQAAQAEFENDRDLRPEEQMELDQDFRLLDEDVDQINGAKVHLRFNDLDTPMSPPIEGSIPPTASSSEAPGLTLDALSTLAALAGKDSGLPGGLSLPGDLNLAEILSKVESAQSGSTSAMDVALAATEIPPQTHQYSQEDPGALNSPVIAQIHGEFFQQPNKYNTLNQYYARPTATAPASNRFPTPGIRPTSTNPRGGYFQTPTNMSRFRTVPCKYFLAGTCNFGEACRFLHTTLDGQIVPHKPIAAQQSQFGATQQISPPKTNDTSEIAPGTSSSSFMLALAPKSSTQSMEAAANFMQRGNYRGGRRGFRGGSSYRRDYDERPSRNRRSPRRYDERRRHLSPSRRRRRSRSNSSRSSSQSSRLSPEYDDRRRKARRERSTERRDRSPVPRERRSPSYDQHRESSDRERSRSRSASPKRSGRRSSRHESP